MQRRIGETLRTVAEKVGFSARTAAGGKITTRPEGYKYDQFGTILHPLDREFDEKTRRSFNRLSDHIREIESAITTIAKVLRESSATHTNLNTLYAELKKAKSARRAAMKLRSQAISMRAFPITDHYYSDVPQNVKEIYANSRTLFAQRIENSNAVIETYFSEYERDNQRHGRVDDILRQAYNINKSSEDLGYAAERASRSASKKKTR